MGRKDEMYLIGEVIFDMTICAAEYLRGRVGFEHDSRDVYAEIYKWAHEFEDSGYDPEDYLAAVEEFATKKLRDYFGE